MNKAYSRINFQNAPSTATPLNATNLNKMDKAINDLDDRIIELSGYQEEAEESAEMASASASAAAKAAETATADAEARVNEVIQGLEVYTKADSHKKFASVIKQVATGSPILITDSSDATAIDFKGKGRSTQKQYSGKNKLPSNINGTFTAYTDLVSVDLPIGTYTLSLDISSSGKTNYESCVMLINESGGTQSINVTRGTSLSRQMATFTITSRIVQIRILAERSYDLSTGDTLVIANAQIEEGTVATDYEPYVGGTASPNPDYPQDIKSVGECGYFDGELLQGHYDASTGIYNSSNAKYVCSKNPMPCTTGDTVNLVYEESARVLAFIFYDKDMKFISANQKATSNTLSATVPDNAKYMHINVSIIDGNIAPSAEKKIVVTINDTYALIVKSVGAYERELAQGYYSISNNGQFVSSNGAKSNLNPILCNSGDMVTVKANCENVSSIRVLFFTNSGSFISGGNNDNTNEITLIAPANASYYHFSILTTNAIENIFVGLNAIKYIPLNEPLRSSLDGTVKDEVSLTECKVDRKNGIVNAKDLTWSIFTYGTAHINTTMFKSNEVSDMLVTDGNIVDSMCNRFNTLPNGFDTLNIDGEWTIHAGNKCFYICINNDRANTVDKLLAWLDSNPTYFQYLLAEPVVETIEPVDIVTYDNVTYISNADNAEMEVTYATDTKSYIDSKFAELHAALVNML